MHPLETPLARTLGIRYALLLAPMTGGPSTPELAAAVTRAGGLGVLGLTGMTPEAVDRDVRAAKRLADGGPIGANVQLADRTPPTGDRTAILAVLAPFRAELGLPPEPPEPAPATAPSELLRVALAAGADVATTFGLPTAGVPLARAAGVPLLAMVTTPADARRAVELGADVVIAQSGESGGHRSTFDDGRDSPEVGLLALLPQTVAAVAPVSVVASGGIGDGHGIRAALALGAQGVSLGTRFLAATECGIADAHRAALRDVPPDGTVVTTALTGRRARWVRNRLVDAVVAADVGDLGWGAQGGLIADLRRAAAAQGRVDLLPILAGQAAALAREAAPAEAICAALLAEAAAGVA